MTSATACDGSAVTSRGYFKHELGGREGIEGPECGEQDHEGKNDGSHGESLPPGSAEVEAGDGTAQLAS